MARLVSVLPSDLARTRGGAERYAFELHAALHRELPGWDMDGVVVATDSAARHVPDGWTPLTGRALRRLPSGDAIPAAKAFRTLARADVVICHQWRTRAATALRVAAALRRRTCLVGMDHGGGTRLGYVLSWIPLPAADVGAHQSEFEAGISPIRARRHVVVRGGIDDDRFRPDDGRPQAIDFLMVGRFLPYKGQLRFLESMPAGASARLVGPSDSEDPDYLSAVVELAERMGVAIRFDVSDEELVDTYRSARYTVQVPLDFRRYEGAAPPELLGLTMLEAMACGSVPICPSTGASAEFVKHGKTGLNYEAGSGSSLAAVLRAAADDCETYPQVRAEALAESRRWTWAAAAADLANAFRASTRSA